MLQDVKFVKVFFNVTRCKIREVFLMLQDVKFVKVFF